MQEVRLGRPRLEALEDLGRRSGVEDLNNFVQAIVQSEQLGSGVARILRIQSDEVRMRRLVTAQERGAKASLKMLLPMLGCIFPTLWVILLGPAALLALHFLRNGGLGRTSGLKARAVRPRRASGAAGSSSGLSPSGLSIPA